jgi:hypothetical protein
MFHEVGPPRDHRAVIALRVPRDERVLLRIEERVTTILPELLGLVADGGEDGNRFALAGRGDQRGRAGVLLHVFGIWLEAAVRGASGAGERWVDRLEVADDGVHGLP